MSGACPSCGSTNARMSFSRIGDHGYRVRRRQCLNCEQFFSTVELPEELAERALEPAKADRKAALLLAADVLRSIA